MKSIFQLMAILAVVGLACTVMAKDGKGGGGDKGGKGAGPMPDIRGKVTAVDTTANTVTLMPKGDGAQAVTVKVDGTTKISVDGTDGKAIADIKVGMVAGVFGQADKVATKIVAKTPDAGGGDHK
jgi:hypothetical protein